MTKALEQITLPRLRWVARLRLLGLAGGGLLTLLALRAVTESVISLVLLVLGLLALVDVLLWLFLRQSTETELPPKARSALLYGQITLDILGLTILLHLAGGSENPFFPFYALSVIVAAALLSRAATFGFAALCSILYAAILAGEAYGWLPHYHLSGLQDPLLYQRGFFLLAQGVALTGLCFLTGEATTTLGQRLRTRARELAESNVRAEARAAHMHELNDQLRTAHEESRHRQQHLDALYLEVQAAHDRLEIRSQHMSELNEQLRAANAECKKRREELQEVNSRLQEAYQRLETRTENMQELNERLRAANAECKAQRDELESLNARLAIANARLQELDDARAQFTLLVTHELRAPVAAIQSYLKLIIEGYVKEPQVRETLEKAERRAMEQLALIADLLELGRIQSANARGLVRPVHVEQALAEQLDLMAARALERGIQLHADVEADLPPVMANPDQLKSVWSNLISNAIKYNRDNGEVEIRLHRQGERLAGSVRDTGIGIPPEAMQRLFSEFFRAENAKAQSRMGTGLGLSIVKEIIERNGGQISCESGLNQGTTFRFWMPVCAEGDQRVTQEPRLNHSG